MKFNGLDPERVTWLPLEGNVEKDSGGYFYMQGRADWDLQQQGLIPLGHEGAEPGECRVICKAAPGDLAELLERSPAPDVPCVAMYDGKVLTDHWKFASFPIVRWGNRTMQWDSFETIHKGTWRAPRRYAVVFDDCTTRWPVTCFGHWEG